ncbi:MAG TPA: hypothetical protein VMC85_07450 [Desulfomonilaceae bacterium]|nr:hypothetical protein [Desulfomonilaceae bacterium]
MWAPFHSKSISLSLCLLLLILFCGHCFPAFGYPAPPSDRFQEKFKLQQDPEALLADILSRREFKEAATESVLDKLIETLRHFLQRALVWLFSRFAGLGPVNLGSEFMWTTVAIVLLIALLASVVMVYARFIFLRPRKIRGAGRKFAEQGPELWDIGELQAQALSIAQQGNYREALILLFRFVLLKLDGLGYIKWHPCKTNREILKSVDDKTAVHEHLAEMISVFNRVCYGDYVCGNAEFQRFLALSQAVTQRSGL